MLSICIETATTSVGVAVGDERGVLASLEVHDGRRHAETLVPAIDSLLRFLQRGRTDITHIGVDVGPGLFTGLRVGVSTAKGLALALGVPVVPFVSLELLALGAAAHAPDGSLIAAVIDARRGELYAGLYRRERAGVTVAQEPFVASAPAVLSTCATATIAVGDASAGVFGSIVDATALVPSAVTMARAMADAACDGSLDARCRRGDDVELLYLRASDAELLQAR